MDKTNSMESESTKIMPPEKNLAALKWLKLIVLAFLCNALMASITLLTKGSVDPIVTRSLAFVWVAATISYSVSAGFYFSIWGRYRGLWGVVILLLQPASLICTFPYIIYRSFKYSWHQNA